MQKFAGATAQTPRSSLVTSADEHKAIGPCSATVRRGFTAGATVSMQVPNVALFVGLEIHTAFAVIDVTQFLAIGTISDPFAIAIQP